MAVSRISPDGSQLTASTFIGGNSNENGEGITIDSAGNVFFSGDSWSADFPVTPDAYQLISNGGQEGIVLGLSSDLSVLIYSTFLGGSSDDASRAFTIDPQGCLFHAGWTQSVDFPLKSPIQDTLAGGWDLAAAKLCPLPGVEDYRVNLRGRPRFQIRRPAAGLAVECTLPRTEVVEFTLYDSSGRRLDRERRIVSGGRHTVCLPDDGLTSGVFFLRIDTSRTGEILKVLIVR
jgi:hypothetical protein